MQDSRDESEPFLVALILPEEKQEEPEVWPWLCRRSDELLPSDIFLQTKSLKLNTTWQLMRKARKNEVLHLVK